MYKDTGAMVTVHITVYSDPSGPWQSFAPPELAPIAAPHPLQRSLMLCGSLNQRRRASGRRDVTGFACHIGVCETTTRERARQLGPSTHDAAREAPASEGRPPLMPPLASPDSEPRVTRIGFATS
jgi:hypothetical protein